MARLEILEYPDKRLRLRAEPVEEVDDTIRNLVSDMLETMYAAAGIGLAATQVNVRKRVLVIDVSETRDEPYVLINPEIVHAEGKLSSEEGCLSVPDVFDYVERAERIRATYLDRAGQPAQLDAEDLLAVCVQHEIDHLDGKLFVDYLSELKRQRLKKKALKKVRRSAHETPPRQSISARLI